MGKTRYRLKNKGTESPLLLMDVDLEDDKDVTIDDALRGKTQSDVDLWYGGTSGSYLISGGVAWSGALMTFDVTAVSYVFDGISGSTPDTQVVLSDGDATHPRIDAVVVDDLGVIQVLEGTPSADPVSPTVEDDQLLIAYINVLAGATSPDVNLTVIWSDDAVGDAVVTESGSGTVISNGTNDPKTGSFHIAFTDSDTARTKYVYLDTASTIQVVDGDILTFWMRKDDTTEIDSCRVRLRLYMGTSAVGSTYTLNAFDQTRDDWQLMVVPINSFGNITEFDRIRVQHYTISNTGAPFNTLDWSMDEVLLQNGLIPNTSTIRWEDIQGDPADSSSLVDYVAAQFGGYELGLACGDETSDIAVATDVLTFQMPNFATTLTGVSFNLKTAPTGSVATFDLNEGGVSVLSTKVTIDAGETTSETAATPPVISDSSISANAIMTVDIDGIGSTIAGVGLKMWIYYTKA